MYASTQCSPIHVCENSYEGFELEDSRIFSSRSWFLNQNIFFDQIIGHIIQWRRFFNSISALIYSYNVSLCHHVFQSWTLIQDTVVYHRTGFLIPMSEPILSIANTHTNKLALKLTQTNSSTLSSNTYTYAHKPNHSHWSEHLHGLCICEVL
jgi:hypothetical protein